MQSRRVLWSKDGVKSLLRNLGIKHRFERIFKQRIQIRVSNQVVTGRIVERAVLPEDVTRIGRVDVTRHRVSIECLEAFRPSTRGVVVQKRNTWVPGRRKRAGSHAAAGRIVSSHAAIHDSPRARVVHWCSKWSDTTKPRSDLSIHRILIVVEPIAPISIHWPTESNARTEHLLRISRCPRSRQIPHLESSGAPIGVEDSLRFTPTTSKNVFQRVRRIHLGASGQQPDPFHIRLFERASRKDPIRIIELTRDISSHTSGNIFPQCPDRINFIRAKSLIGTRY